MIIYSVKILIAVITALVLLFLVRKYLKGNPEKKRFVRSLPGNMVQEIADRFDEEGAVEKYLESFFQCPYTKKVSVIESGEAFDSYLETLQVPAEEKKDLLRVIGAVDENDLLAYALAPETDQKKVVILAICRVSGDKQGVEVYVFQPGRIQEA